MSVDRTDYLMFAVDVGYDAFDWEKHEAELEGAPTARFDIVYDGMCGKYCLAGKVIAQSDPYEGFERAAIDMSKFVLDQDELCSKVNAAFEQKHSPQDFKLIIFSHFS